MQMAQSGFTELETLLNELVATTDNQRKRQIGKPPEPSDIRSENIFNNLFQSDFFDL